MPSHTLDLQKKKELIAESRWFEGLPSSAMEKLATSSSSRRYAKGEFIYLVGDIPSKVSMVVTGKVRISLISVEGQKFLLTDLEHGQWFGEAALAGESTGVHEARAEEDSVLLEIPRQTVMTVADQHPSMYKSLLFSHLYRTGAVYELLAGMVFYPLKSRLAGRLINLADRHGRETGDGIKLEVKMSQLEFAQMTMGSRQRVNKVLREWVQRGILQKQKDYYVIADMDRLQAEIEPSN